jgi:hypothetical protein
MFLFLADSQSRPVGRENPTMIDHHNDRSAYPNFLRLIQQKEKVVMLCTMHLFINSNTSIIIQPDPYRRKINSRSDRTKSLFNLSRTGEEIGQRALIAGRLLPLFCSVLARADDTLDDIDNTKKHHESRNNQSK